MTRLIKIGSALIGPSGQIDHSFLAEKCSEIAKLIALNDKIILISSGAVAAGMEVEKLSVRPQNTLELQLLSGIGQTRLMKYYSNYFEQENLQAVQVLLTHYNFDHPKEEQTIKSILTSYLNRGVIPIINENDLVNKEELDNKGDFTDNDILAALVAERTGVEQAILLTDIAGLMRASNPKESFEHAELIHTVSEVNESIKQLARDSNSNIGLGGMYSKIIAAKKMMRNGIEVIVGNGHLPLSVLIKDKTKRTVFVPTPRESE